MTDILDRSSPIPRVTWGVFLSVVAVIVAGTTWKNRSDTAHTELRAATADVGDRQAKYIDRRNTEHAVHKEWSEKQHADQQKRIEQLEDELHRVCEGLAVHIQEAICH